MSASATKEVSASEFFQAASAAWDYLHPSTQQAVRQSSSTGRTLHDSRITDLVVRLGHSKPDAIDQVHSSDGGQGAAHALQDAGPTPPPTPTELRAMLAGVVERGARLQRLRMRFLRPDGGAHRPPQEREDQLLAVLDALSGCPVTTVVMSGGVPLSRAVASAVASAFPSLVELRLSFEWEDNDLPQGHPNGEAASEYYYGAMQLLTRCGPRLRELDLDGGVQHWPAVAFQALRECTALTRLGVEAGRTWMEYADGQQPLLSCPFQEETLVTSIAQLTNLRSLSLESVLTGDVVTPEVLANHGTCWARLSALTALTQLSLQLAGDYSYHGDSCAQRPPEEDDHEAWCEAQEVHRTALLVALRAMPQLQDLDCPTLWLKPSELAQLAAPTGILMGGLLPQEQQPGALPASLTLLRLCDAVSPRVLASMTLPDSLTGLCTSRLRFGMSDVTPDNQLLPETVAAVGPAVQRLSAHHRGELMYFYLTVEADGAPGLLKPRAGVAEGHAEWLGQLAGLECVDTVQLSSLALQFEDVCCLAASLGRCRRLGIVNSSFPVAAITALLGLEATEELLLDLSLAMGVTAGTLETALTVLGLQARKLQLIRCTNCPLPHCQELQHAVTNKLRSKGKDGIQLLLLGGS